VKGVTGDAAVYRALWGRPARAGTPDRQVAAAREGVSF
jgi:hypothetical protein